MLQHHIIQFLLNGCLCEVKTKENFKFLALEVVTMAYERWLLIRGSKYSELTAKHLDFWKTGV